MEFDCINSLSLPFYLLFINQTRGYKTFCWHFNIYEQEKIAFSAYLSLKKAEFLHMFIFMSI